MSAPLPGPMRPPTDDPKSNVLLYGAIGAVLATFALATLAPGSWRLLAIPCGCLAVLLVVAAFRTRVASVKRDLDRG